MLKKISPYILISALPILLHAPVWLGRIDFFSGDGSDLIPYVYGVKLLQYETLHEFGELLLWNPYLFFGQPVIGNIEYSLFYPLNLFFLAFSFFTALWLYNVVHLIIAGLGTYLLCRQVGIFKSGSLIAACLFMLNGRLLYYINAGWVDHFGSICWLPLILLAARCVLASTHLKYSALLAAALAMSFLAGTPQYALLASFLFILQCLYSFIAALNGSQRLSLLLRSSLAGLLFTLLVSIQLLPTFEQAGLSSRVFFTGEAYGFHFDFDAGQWFRLFLRPEVARQDYAWELCAYIGIGGLILATWGATKIRGFRLDAVIWGLLPILISLGPAFPPAAFLIKSIPGMSLLTSASRYLIFSILILCILAGRGLEKVLPALEKGSLRVRVYLVVMALVLSILGIFLAPLSQGNVNASLRFWIMVGLFFTSIGLYAWRKSLPWRLFLFGALVVDPLLFAPEVLTGYQKSDLRPPARIIAALESYPETVRIATIQPPHLRDDLLNPFDDWLSAAYRIRRAGGYDPLAMLRSLQYLAGMDGTGDIKAAMWGFRPWAFARPALYNIAGITHLVTFEPIEHPRLDPVAQDTITMPHFHGGWWQSQPVYLYQNKGVLPRAFFKAHGSSAPVTAIATEETSPNRLRLQIDTRVPGVVVLSESFHPGWTAVQPSPPIVLQPFLETFISFQVEPGQHDILLEFSPHSYRRGRLLSLAGLVLMGFVLLFSERLARYRATRH